VNNNVSKVIRVSAPGTLMLLGEHAVLHGAWSLVCAINRRMTVTLRPTHNSKVIITSALGRDEAAPDALPAPRAPFQFVWAALRSFSSLPSGCEIEIESSFSEKIGFGSSAAVTVALVAAVRAWQGLAWDREAMHQHARDVIRSVQGQGSGADVAGCVFGGIVAYRAHGPDIVPLPGRTCPIAATYCGYKTPTADVIARVDDASKRQPELFNQLFQLINACAIAGRDAVERADWASLGEIMNMHQGLHEALGVGDIECAARVFAFRNEPGVLGAKISGSGLGDCVTALGTVHNDSFPYPLIPIEMEEKGVARE